MNKSPSTIILQHTLKQHKLKLKTLTEESRLLKKLRFFKNNLHSQAQRQLAEHAYSMNSEIELLRITKEKLSVSYENDYKKISNKVEEKIFKSFEPPYKSKIIDKDTLFLIDLYRKNNLLFLGHGVQIAINNALISHNLHKK